MKTMKFNFCCVSCLFVWEACRNHKVDPGKVQAEVWATYGLFGSAIIEDDERQRNAMLNTIVQHVCRGISQDC
jgi:hypothetical protein